jgi:hypothetical protein
MLRRPRLTCRLSWDRSALDLSYKLSHDVYISFLYVLLMSGNYSNHQEQFVI